MLFVLISLTLACQNSSTEAPDDLLSESQMAQILSEIHLAEARVTKLNRVSQDSNTLIYKHLEKRIFQKYKVDTAAYSKSYTYYSSNPEQLADIYKQVTAELERRKKLTDTISVAKATTPVQPLKPADSSKTGKKKLTARIKTAVDSSHANKNKLPARLKNLKK
ncbi:hypothetical protein GCM10028804_22480 [Larkinella terrae]|uniref:DUF4296 domain-containing protein n=2 Tax=Larkinella terrae TaxID=2025311 RepID=A0A7K0EI59_9BACT|nr:DUF4296 domain-containing protein [Larkinella terrae]